MIKKFKFTNDRIRSLPPNPQASSSTDLEVSDTETTGLKCLSGKSGSKRFLLRYVFNSRKRSITLGRFPDIDVATARKAARTHRAMIAEGKDPKSVQEAQQQAPTVSEFFWQTFLPLQKKHKKSWSKDAQRFRDYCEPYIGHLLYTDLKASHVQQIQLRLNEPTKNRPAYANATCNRALAVLKTMGQCAVRFDVVPVNEAMKIKQLRENNARTRFLDSNELRSLIIKARQYKSPFIGGFIAMLAITGCRNSEIRLAQHTNLDKANRTLFIPTTKNGRSRTLYLSDLAMEILDNTPTVPGNPYIFAGRKPGKPLTDCRVAYRQLLTQAGIEDASSIVFHTLRHSVASSLVSAGSTLYDVKFQLGHSSIQSTERYSKQTAERQRNTSEKLSALVR